MNRNDQPQQHKRMVKRGEVLAMKSDAIHADQRAIWWDFYTPTPTNSRVGASGSVAVVDVRGSLDHHRGYGCDSYEAILDRAREAFSGEDVVNEAIRKAYWAGGTKEDAPTAQRPKAVVLRIDSPGGVVSGLNETVFALRRMAKESGIPLVAYVDELAASAAYAIACACSEIVMPPSAIAGSVGVISAMYDVTEADAKAGLKFVTLTSGARKADGHPHIAITDAALNAEQRRVDKLAAQFFRIVSTARGIPVEKVESFQAGIFLAREAVAKGLANVVQGWEETIAALDESGSVVPTDTDQSEPGVKKALAQPVELGANTKRKPTDRSVGKESHSMRVTLKAAIKRVTASLAKETDPAKCAVLARSLASYESSLEAYKKEQHTIEKHTKEESEEPEESAESEETEESAESDEAEKAESKGDDDEKDDDDDDDDEKEEKKASASLAAFASKVTGKSGRAALGALTAKLAAGDRALELVNQMARERNAEKKAATIAAALGERRITPAEAKDLAKKKLSFVSGFLGMRKTAIVNAEDGELGGSERPGAGADLSPAVLRSVEVALDASGITDAPAREAMRTQLIDEQRKARAALNGAPGRY